MLSTNRTFLAYGFSAGFLSAIAFISIFFPYSRNNENKLKSADSNRRKKVVVFGDSITQHGFNPANNGWVNSLNNWWTRRVDIMNRGYSGYNSQWGLMILSKVVISENPDMVFVFFGANDAVDSSVKQYVPLEQFRHNIRLIVLELRSKLAKDLKLVLITPPPIWEETLKQMNEMKGKPLALDRTNIRTLQYVAACKDIGSELSVPVLDLWSDCEGNSDNRALYLIDGLHLNSKGNDRLFESAKELIKTHYPEFLPESMPMQMPEWSQVDIDHPVF